MNQREIIEAILSKDEAKITEAKQSIKSMLDVRATRFMDESSKFIAKSLFAKD